jgi:DNA-binding IclR family transcriptional regulator
MKKARREAQGVQGVEIGMRLVSALASADGPLALRQLAQATGLAPSKAHRYLVSLCRTGLVEQFGRLGEYDLGQGAVTLGLAAQQRRDEYQLADETAGGLRDATRQTVSVIVWGNHGPTVVRRKEWLRPITVFTPIGTVLSVTASASGRVFAAFMPEVAGPLIAAEFSSGSKPTYLGRALDRKGFNSLLAAIKKQRLSHVRGDLVSGIDAWAAPVFNHERRIAMVLTTLGTHGTIDLTASGKHARALLRAADDLSRRLGHRQ